jgi:hypothetical protein
MRGAATKCFDGDIEADFVSVLEAIRHGFRGTVDTNRHAFDRMHFGSGGEGRSAHEEEADG